MTDSLNYQGLDIKDNLTLVEELKTGFKNIYGTDGDEINFDSNTPDGQLIEILAELGTVIREMITEVYNSCDPDKCSGAVQDNRYQINYLFRNNGTYSLQNIDITVNKTVTLEGLDNQAESELISAYTVSDDNGNIWYLVDTQTLTTGTHRLEFRAKTKGAVIPTIGTIKNQVTIVDGVISVNNSVGATAIGTEEESDADFRIRRERSTATKSENNIDVIEGKIRELTGVIDCKVHQNVEHETDETGTLPHFIWVIVEGGTSQEIADIIYANMGGSGTRGEIETPILQGENQIMTVRFDREIIKPLYIKFDLKPIENIKDINIDFVKDYIANNLTFAISENAETSKVSGIVTDALLSDGGNGYGFNCKISKGGVATANIGESTGITSASVVASIFQDVVGDITGAYNFEYTANGWSFDGDIIEISNYGISYEGEPVIGDTIQINYTQGVWFNFLEVESLADKYTTDINKIYINEIES